MAGGAANIYGAATNTAIPGVGTAVGAANIGQQMLNQEGNSEDRAARAEVEAKKAALLYIPIYGQAAYAALTIADAVSGGKATGAWVRADKNINRELDKYDFGLGKSIRSKVFHQSTKGKAMERTGELVNMGKDNQAWLEYISKVRTPDDPDNPNNADNRYVQKYGTFENYKRAGLVADDLIDVYGNLKTFGPNWLNYTPEQRKAITQALIDNGLYDSKKGDIIVTDQEKAREIANQVVGAPGPTTTTTTGAKPNSTPTVQQVVQRAAPNLTPPSNQPAPNPTGRQNETVNYDANMNGNTIGQQVANNFLPNQQQPQPMQQPQQTGGILGIPQLQQPQPNPVIAQPRIGGNTIQPPQVVNYGNQVTQSPQQQIGGGGILGMNQPQQQQVPQPQPQVQQPNVTPQPKVTGRPTVENQKKKEDEVIAQLNKPGGLAGLFNGRRPLAMGLREYLNQRGQQ